MIEGKQAEIDPEWFTKNRIREFSRRLDAHLEKEMLEVERLLKDYLVAMLDLTHRRLIDGRIRLVEYYRTTQALAYCGKRLNHLAEEE